ncbi:MAG: nucleoside recognition domain-containing protein [Lachnospiraceae bacterium]
MKKCFLAFLLLGILVFLLLFPEAALFASRRGLDLWFGTLVPTLLPFLILSGFLIHSGLVQIPAALLAPVFGRLFGISPLGSYACFTGFLCGCPMGAKVLADLTRNGRIAPEEASYLLASAIR